MRAFAGVDIAANDPRYRKPLVASARALAEEIGEDCDVVLLGSIASAKYVDVLTEVFGDRLTFHPVLSEASPGTWDGPTGFVHEQVRAFVGERWPQFEYYFAGPPPMAQAVQQMLIEKRVPFPQVHFDSFY